MLRNTRFENVPVVATYYVVSNASNASSISYISVSVQYMVFAPARKRRRAELLFASHRESWWLNRSPVEVLGPHDRVVVVRGRERIDVAVAFEVDPTYRARVGRRGVDLVGAPAPAASEDIEPAASSSSQRRLCVVESEKDDAADGFHAATSPAASGTIEETAATPKPLSECAWVEAHCTVGIVGDPLANFDWGFSDPTGVSLIRLGFLSQLPAPAVASPGQPAASM